MRDLRLEGLRGAGTGIEKRQRRELELRAETGQTNEQVNQVREMKWGGGEVRESGNLGGRGLVDAR